MNSLSSGDLFHRMLEREKCLPCSVVICKEQIKSADKCINDGSSDETDDINSSNPISCGVAENRPEMTSKLQTIVVRKGQAICDTESAEVGNFQDIENVHDNDGVFWKLSEFERNSGKQGLEERFRLFSPTIIVSCSGSAISSVEGENNDHSRNSEFDDSDKTTGKKMPARWLRKKQPIEYYPKVVSQQDNSENLSNDVAENLHVLTVLDWYKDEVQIRDRNLDNGLSCSKTSDTETDDNKKSKKIKFIRPTNMYLWQTKTVVLSVPEQSGTDCKENRPDKVVVTTYHRGDISETVSVMNNNFRLLDSTINDDPSQRKSNLNEDKISVEGCLADAMNCSFRADLVKNFEIYNILHELNIHPGIEPDSGAVAMNPEVGNPQTPQAGKQRGVSESEMAFSSAFSASKDYVAEPVLAKSKANSYQDNSDCVKALDHSEGVCDNSENVFVDRASQYEDEDFEIIKEQVEHVRNGVSTCFLNVQKQDCSYVVKSPDQDITNFEPVVVFAETNQNGIATETSPLHHVYFVDSQLTGTVKKEIEEHHNYGKKKIDKKKYGEKIMEIREGASCQDESQKYFLSISEKVKFSQRGKRKHLYTSEYDTDLPCDWEERDRHRVFSFKENNHSLILNESMIDIQEEPLDLSMQFSLNPVVSDTLDKQEMGVTIPKRKLRNHSPVDYFPGKNKKRREDIKGKDSGLKSEKHIENGPLTAPTDSVNLTSVMIDVNENVSHDNRIIYMPFDPLELSPKPLNLSMKTRPEAVTDFEMEKCIYRHGLHEKEEKINADAPFQEDLTEMTDVNNNMKSDGNSLKNLDGIKAQCEPNEQEKALNVHRALLGLYAAQTFKEWPHKKLFIDTDENIHGIGDDEFIDTGNNLAKRNLSSICSASTLFNEGDIVMGDFSGNFDHYLNTASISDKENMKDRMVETAAESCLSNMTSLRSDTSSMENTINQTEMDVTARGNNTESYFCDTLSDKTEDGNKSYSDTDSEFRDVSTTNRGIKISAESDHKNVNTQNRNENVKENNASTTNKNNGAGTPDTPENLNKNNETENDVERHQKSENNTVKNEETEDTVHETSELNGNEMVGMNKHKEEKFLYDDKTGKKTEVSHHTERSDLDRHTNAKSNSDINEENEDIGIGTSELVSVNQNELDGFNALHHYQRGKNTEVTIDNGESNLNRHINVENNTDINEEEGDSGNETSESINLKENNMDGANERKCSEELSAVEASPSDKQDFPVGTVVWGKFSKSRWWPAVVVDGKMVRKETNVGRQWIFWLSDYRVSQLKLQDIELFTTSYQKRTTGKEKHSMRLGILKALKICAERARMDLGSCESLGEWGQSSTGFLKLISDQKEEDQFPPDSVSPLPPYIMEQLRIIKRLQMGDSDGVSGPDLNDSGIADLGTPSNALRNTHRRKVDSGSGKLRCISCDDALEEDFHVYKHPIIEGVLCEDCRKVMMSSYYATDDDGTSLYCGICGEGGKQFVCEKRHCGRGFCFNCIERLSGKELLRQVQHTDPWYCFMCTDYAVKTHGKIVPRKEWEIELIKFFQTDGYPMCEDLHYLTSKNKRKIRVLSLYDGIGTGKQVLNELGLDVEVYYASETNPDAMLVASYHHAVTHVGDVSFLTRAELQKLCPIDLVLAGPPCNDLSIVNPQRKGFHGTGLLLIKFICILKDLEALCKDNHVFWLLENTGSMLKEYKQIVVELLGMEPAVWDAKYFTGQRRARNFWGNIPGLYSTPEYCLHLEKERKDLDAALISNCNRRAQVSHMRTITTGTNSLTIRNGEEDLPILMDGKEDGIWVIELERLFGFPEHYTDVGQLTHTTRHRLLGKAWCVPVIKHILSPLRQYFALQKK